MKKPNEIKFPYPFLCEDGGDYVDSNFNINFELFKDENTLELKCDYELKCTFLEKLISEGKAKPVVHIEQRTYRKVQPLMGKNIQIDLEKLSPNYNLEVVGMIVAIQDIEFSYEECMNEIYSYFDEPFKCEKGSILAFSNFEEFELPTEEKISSIFTISEFKDPADIAKGEPFKIDLDGNVINILVLPKIKELFASLREREAGHNKLFNSIFVYPSIEVAVVEMFKNYDSYCNYKWCIALANKLSNAKECSFDILRSGRTMIDKDELIEYTNIILEDLLLYAFVDAAGGDD